MGISSKLKYIKIPIGWKIEYNTLYERIVPIDFVSNDLSCAFDYNEDILQLSKDRMILDLGWYPEHDVSGRFTLVLIKDHNWEKPIYKVESRDIDIICQKIERLLDEN